MLFQDTVVTTEVLRVGGYVVSDQVLMSFLSLVGVIVVAFFSYKTSKAASHTRDLVNSMSESRESRLARMENAQSVRSEQLQKENTELKVEQGVRSNPKLPSPSGDFGPSTKNFE